jgi:hypothetical protein
MSWRLGQKFQSKRILRAHASAVHDASKTLGPNDLLSSGRVPRIDRPQVFTYHPTGSLSDCRNFLSLHVVAS